jgi:hypothetical protein
MEAVVVSGASRRYAEHLQGFDNAGRYARGALFGAGVLLPAIAKFAGA